MKRTLTIFTAILAATLAVSCGAKQNSAHVLGKTHPQWAHDATIYELNTRQLTPQGTFQAATQELPRLKELGVDIIWVMPIQPIGKLERKGSLGSYYAISDYKGFNPEFGVREDFQQFVDQAHQLGMYVILDWVANHTSPDHIWAQNEGWHKRDSMGKMKVQYDWTDITEVDYQNKEMRAAMLDAMEFWVDSINVDGFRCDMAMLVPTDFWEMAVDKMQQKHPDIFMLAEAEKPELTDKAFDMYYGWELHHIMNALAQGRVRVDSLARYFAKADESFAPGALRMNFTSNHDENSWAGSEFERMGDAARAMAALTYIVPGMPLIYSGQELGNSKRLRFFDKDTVERVAQAPQEEFYRSMNALRKAHPALQNGDMMILETSTPDRAFAVQRSTGEDKVTAVFNFSPQKLNTHLKERGQDITLAPWEYLIFEE